jgi:ketosteroid isomerase-like protein
MTGAGEHMSIGSKDDVLRRMFAVIDRRDADGFAEYLASDAELRFGVQPPMIGRAAIRDGIAGFFGTIGGLRHDIRRMWSGEDGAAVEADVVYTRLNGSTVAVPCVSVCRFGARDLINDYRVYIDLAPLFAA